MSQNPVHQIALTHIHGIGAVQARQLIDYFEGDVTAIFKASKKQLSQIQGIGEIKAKAIKEFNNFQIAEAELAFCQKHHIQPLFINHADYPQRLLHCYDAPTVLYYRGNVSLNNSKVVSIIGTRKNTEYGKQITEQIIHDLQPYQVLIVSGLAFGIDAIAHKTSVNIALPTIGVLAHGLQTIYPVQHKTLAKQMLQNGGLLTEFGKDVVADKHNFPRRNRVVAGMADATIVIETAVKGGSMITAELAYNYNKDVFAVPGRITDAKSAGNLKLIQQNKAVTFTDVVQFAENMGWVTKKPKPQKPLSLFVELNEDEQVIMKILSSKPQTHIDEIYLHAGLSSSNIAAAILNLELQNIVMGLPGKMYSIVS
ncbi:MAG: DNA-processing protein DprA [Chitinophagaceae bacterium]